jgi:membrane dipeptidase
MVVFTALTFISCGGGQEDELALQAKELADRLIIIDTHVDTPYRLQEEDADLSERSEGGDFDYPRAIEGGLDAVFMSIFTPPRLEEEGTSKETADGLIDAVEAFATEHPDKFFMATSVQEVTDLTGSGRIALAMGMENGSPIEGSLDNLRHFRDRGIRYITLAHNESNHICDSWEDEGRRWGGLSPFGEELVAEMNRLGVMVDVSHISDESFFQVMQLSRAPVIASHSACRHFSPGFERNMSDDMIRLLAERGGVIQITFSSWFLSDEYRAKDDAAEEVIRKELEAKSIEPDSKEGREYWEEYIRKKPIPVADVSAVADHIDHVVQLVGIDHVGLGSDFDGAGPSMPTGLSDVSGYPNLIRELLERGYSEDDIAKVCGGNLLRVWSEVEGVAAEMQPEG